MPPRKKVETLPEEQKDWLKSALRDAGFAGYEQIAEELNRRLAEDGCEIRVHRSSVQRFGQEYESFVRYQEEAAAWAADWISDEGMEDEAKRHGVLFQMLTTLAFRYMRSQADEDAEIDPKDLHFMGRMLKDVMASSGLRQKLVAEERNLIAEEARRAAAASVEKSARQLGLTKDAVAGIKAQILGVET